MDDPFPDVPNFRCFKHQVHNMCPEFETLFGSKLQFHSLYFDIFRNGRLCGQYSKCDSYSVGALVRYLFNTKV